MKKIATFIFALFMVQLGAQTPNEILASELDTFILEHMEQHNIPGLSACIVKGDQIVWKAAYGMANISTNTPVSLGTEFILASISKLFTATACAQLWENGDLDIDADINDYLPITVINPNFPDEPITARQLLTHKSSLHDSESDLQLWDALGDPIYELADFCEAYFTEGGNLYVPANFGSTAPGQSNYWYSNAGFTLLGYIVEEINGVPFNQYCKTHILAPLQMNTAGWFYANMDTTDIAMPYNGAWQPYGYYSVPEYPAAMLKANVEELANFLIAYTQKGVFQGNQLVNENTFSNVVPSNMANGFGWWGTDTWWGDPAGDFWSHGGFMNGVRTQLNYYPSDSTGLIILTNGEGSYLALQNKIESYIPLFQTETTLAAHTPARLNFHIFPNPVFGEKKLTVQFESEDVIERGIEIYGANGDMIYSKKSSLKNTQIDLSKYAAGVYFLKITEKNKTYSREIIVN